MLRATIVSRVSIAALALCLVVPAARAGDSAAHAIADKFAGGPEARKEAEEKANEQDMLDRARREALERKAAAEKTLALEEAEEKRLAEEATKKAEAERLARDVEEKRIAEQKRLAEEATKNAEAERLARDAEEKRIAEQKRLAEEATKKAEAERMATMEAEREAKAQQLEAKLRALEASRQDKSRIADEVARDNVSTQAPEIGRPDADSHVTVLLVMKPGKTGIRRFGEKTADPVLCSTSSCWVSGGSAAPARTMQRGQALGPGNTLGKRAASCNHKLACVFRGLDLGGDKTWLQPIDLRIMRHDRREPMTVERDATCKVAGERLTCAQPIEGKTWRAWIVPEAVAERAGAKALEDALNSDLDAGHHAALE